jgi:hypothetical protein
LPPGASAFNAAGIGIGAVAHLGRIREQVQAAEGLAAVAKGENPIGHGKHPRQGLGNQGLGFLGRAKAGAQGQ